MPPTDLSGILVIIPCSKGKCRGGDAEVSEGTILQDLPPDLATKLSASRKAVAPLAKLDEARLMPAWRRYTGRLNKAARGGLGSALASGRLPHLLILSGGYGVVRATDPIGWYERELHLNDWKPSGMLGEVMCAYARRHGLSRVRAFAGSSTRYAKALQGVHRHGLTDVILYSPKGGSSGTTPIALGEALASMLSGSLGESWRSSHGLALEALPIR
jgi:hypothetical protein